MYVQLEPLLAIIAGILILLIPRFLNFIVAVYLIIVGIGGLLKTTVKADICRSCCAS